MKYKPVADLEQQKRILFLYEFFINIENDKIRTNTLQDQPKIDELKDLYNKIFKANKVKICCASKMLAMLKQLRALVQLT